MNSNDNTHEYQNNTFIHIFTETANSPNLVKPGKPAARRLRAHPKSYRLLAAALAVVVLFTFMLAGCSKDEIGLLSAVLKAPQKTSYEYEGSASVELRFDIFEQGEDAILVFSPPISVLKSLEEMINGAGVNISAKYSGNLENTKGATEMHLTPVYMGGTMSDLTTSVWADVDLEAPIILKEYIKFPKIFTAGIGWDYFKGRDYLTMTSEDFNVISDQSDLGLKGLFDPESLMEQIDASEKLSASFNDAIIMLAGMMDSKTAYITSVSKNDGGDSVYHINITDKGLKELVMSFVNMDKSDLKEALRMMLTVFVDYIQGLGLDENDEMGDFFDMANMGLSQFDLAFDIFYPQVVETMNKYFGKSSKIKLLGNDGINLDICISEDGYITGCDGVIDLIIDIRGFTISSGERFNGNISKAHFKLNFKNSFSNVNGDVVIEMPKITRLNSISMSRIIEVIAEENARLAAQYTTPYGLDPNIVLEGTGAENPSVQERPDMLGELPAEPDYDDAAATDAAAAAGVDAANGE